MIHLDHYLKIGDSHKVCEDYVISRIWPIPHIIISDGCSSSYETDMGARILTHVANRYIELNYASMNDPERMGSWIIHNADSIRRQLSLKSSCLDATLIIAYLRNDELEIIFFGDGYCMINDDTMIEVSYSPENAPYYLSYQLDSWRDEKYHNLGNELVISYYDRHNENYKIKEQRSYDQIYHNTFPQKQLNKFSLFSDGISSFYSNDGRHFDPMKAVTSFKMLDFKTTKGEFLKRRMGAPKGAINMAKEQGFKHVDDLSVGVFLLEEE